MKRKTEDKSERSSKKLATSNGSIRQHFRADLFDEACVSGYADDYAQSGPYKHAVISDLIDDGLLRSVRNEIRENIHFTPKETDIYKIHQSGDLANLDGLPASALEKLPSLLKLRDAMYSSEFREWVSSVSGAGKLSGTKTDMAVNVYVPGCHLLCHDDVIGSRRVSYILYLNDPDKPWQPEWGGALRLFPTDEVQDRDGKTFKFPRADWTKSIPPAWNQLSFFAVQPGESFHDVEEVYQRHAGESEDDGGRIRMAISGWFHIPQEGEDGFELGLEEKLAERSSLQQLQGSADEFDQPQHEFRQASTTKAAAAADNDEDEGALSEEDLQFLLQFMTPNYLTPDTVEELNELFMEESTVQLSNFLGNKFAPLLREELTSDAKDKYAFQTSRPPHKHHYQYLQSSSASRSPTGPFRRVLDELLPSEAFAKWLALVTGATVKSSAIMARRFRKGVDYQLAQGYDGEEPLLEYTLCVTPTSGWGGEESQEEAEGESSAGAANGQSSNGKAPAKEAPDREDEDNIGGYELYMAGDDDDNDDGSDDGVTVPANIKSQTGAGDRRSAKKKKADPAVYQAAGDGEDDGILFSNGASWNTLSIVLRDRGTLKFVKYVSKAAPGDRFDFTGRVEVEFDDDEDEDEE